MCDYDSMKFRRSTCLVLLLPLLALCAGEYSPKLFSALHWRLVGPFRGGRITAITGVPGEPYTFLAGTPGGGVWRTTNAGVTWQPIFDQVAVPSIGAIAVAPSDAKTIYVGTGEQIPGEGVYKSIDGGTTWNAMGLSASRFIQSIVVDPRDPRIVIVGANDAGASVIWSADSKSPYAAGSGIYKTVNGGQTWTKAFNNDASVGVVDMCSDPSNPNILYASFYTRASGKGDSAVAATSQLYKSTDEGTTWKPLSNVGLPEKDRGREGIAVAPGNKGRRLYTIVNQGLFRSDDAGASWKKMSNDTRVIGSEYFGRVFVDPHNPEIVYVPQTSLYRSTDGGQKFEAFAGAPSGDDYHLVWTDPSDTSHIILGVDQGAVLSLDGGKTWSSWDNQPTGQFYHVSTDNAFPYRIYAAQQDSGTAAILSRSDNGRITSADWYSIAGFEDCQIAPDPLNPDIVYSGGWYGTVVRFDRATSQAGTVFLAGPKYRTSAAAPLFFLPQDPHALILGTQFVMKSTDGGNSWRELSPDLTLKPKKADDDKGKDKKDKDKKDKDKDDDASLNSLSPSTLDAGIMWAGTTNGVVQVTRDAGTSWQNVSPANLPDKAMILNVEASHHDPATAYITVGARHEALSPRISQTRDFGKSWTQIISGIPPTEAVHVVREDPVRKGLLYAGTSGGVYVSFDDGDHWQTLQLNLPPAPVTDLTVHGADLVASTFGRALWVLDNISPLREAGPAHLLTPETAVRTHWDNYQDTPLSVETPAGTNPPDGAIIDYYLQKPPVGEVTLAIYDSEDKLVRVYSSSQSTQDLPPPNVPEYWFAPPEVLPRTTGLNRFVWDLRYPPPQALPFGYFGKLLEYTEYTLADHAVPGATPRRQPLGPLVLPGNYRLELTVDGEKYGRQLNVKLDPRVRVSGADLEAQLNLERQITAGMSTSFNGYRQVEATRKELEDRKKALSSDKDATEQLKAFETKLDEVQNGSATAPGFGLVNRELARYIAGLETFDARPSETALSSVQQECSALDTSLAKWRDANGKDLEALNATLQKKAAKAIASTKAPSAPGCAK